ncbi:hypothetical protein PAAG_12465 [Paracoccidioides lutzii Pb01]|uniref:Uncharacterized protein n=1 Tax=Paracoccidioides lutzii (strain ATCC MYA-826 / Pb01) TaxID=502779 RepID=A0A0A2UZ70_PARBA|nr:hypothetical protein PAAG_12465 [Paracoccidioides lutzii Pb01]KGQ00876.1 hypothetical protein PAAG_12465 [Paracoccidioides lutzii Pb01]
MPPHFLPYLTFTETHLFPGSGNSPFDFDIDDHGDIDMDDCKQLRPKDLEMAFKLMGEISDES